MKWWSSLLIFLAAGRAWAEEPAIAVERVDPAACFDAAHLAARLRESFSGGEVRIGGGAAETVVAVSVRAGTLEVVVTRRARSEHRTLPLDPNCNLLTDAVAMIVARIAAPLGFRPLAPATVPAAHPVARAHPSDGKTAKTPPPPATSPSVAKATTPPAATAPSTAKVSAPPASPSAAKAATPVANGDPAPPDAPLIAQAPVAPPTENGNPDAPIEVARPRPPPRHRARVFLDAAFRYSLPLDGASESPQPGLLASLDVRIYRRWILTAAGGFEGASHTGDNGPGATLWRAPFRAGAQWELPIPSGSVRFGAGGLLELWHAGALNVAHATDGTALHPGVYASVAYHLTLGHFVDLFAGVDLEYTWVTESFVVAGVGEVAATSHIRLCPMAGASVNFF